MRLLAAFIAHEARTQWRSTRFRVLSAVYVALTAAPAVIPYTVYRLGRFVVGPAMFSSMIDALQPWLTFLFAFVLSVDAIAREREEGSLAVVGLAPLSNSGYVFRRWIAAVVVMIPITLVPRLAAAGLAWTVSRRLSPVFILGWTTSALPHLLIGSALALSLGTITGRTVLAALAAAAVFTMGLELANDALARVHRHVEGAGPLLELNPRTLDRLAWAARGWAPPPMPTEAGIEVRPELQSIAIRAAVPAAIAVVLLGIAPLFLRRARADLRPWRIRQDHPLRTILRMMNRLREEYWPDPAPAVSDLLAMGGGVVAALLLCAFVVRRNDLFESAAAEQYAAWTSPSPRPTAVSLVPVTIQIRGGVSADGEVQTSSSITMRNDGPGPEWHLAFSISPGLRVTRALSSHGAVALRRNWDRLTLETSPPIASGESRTFSFETAGRPGAIRYPFDSRTFIAHYRKHAAATQSFEIVDFSKSAFLPAANAVRTELHAADLAPVPRYTKWDLVKNGDEVTPAQEQVSPAAMMDMRLDLPSPLAADSCGTLSVPPIRSRCTFPPSEYLLLASSWKTTPVSDQVTLAHFEQPEEITAAHAGSLAGAIASARRSWPGLDLAGPLVIAEQPTVIDAEDWYFYYGDVLSSRSMSASGALELIPERLMAARKPLDTSQIAASLVANTLVSRRRMEPRAQRFYRLFLLVVASSRNGGGSTGAVVPSGGPPPDTHPVIDSWHLGRLQKVFSDLEYRVGSDNVVAGINDFVRSSNTSGTARALFQAIGARGRTSLDRMYDDYIEGTALPELTLSGVSFRHDSGNWVVSGSLRNEGTGEVFCPIVLRTDVEPLRQTVRADGHQTVPFRFETPLQPRTVQLDPDHVCYRFAAPGLIDSVEFRGSR